MRSLFLCLGLLLALTAGATTYKWVDKNGVTHYSDRPVPGAVPVELTPAQTYTPPAAAEGAAPAQAGTASTAPAAYTTFEIWSPANDESFVNTGNKVTVRLRLEPDLRPEHSLVLYLDGRRVDGTSPTDLNLELTNVERGTHTVTAVLVGGDGKVVKRTSDVTFHLRQASLNAPGRN